MAVQSGPAPLNCPSRIERTSAIEGPGHPTHDMVARVHGPGERHSLTYRSTPPMKIATGDRFRRELEPK